MRTTPRKATSRRIAISESLEPRRLFAVNPTVIDLLVLYTTQAKNGETARGASITAEIQSVVDFTNTAMQNSQVPVTIRLVHTQEITDYSPTGSVMQDELNMQGSGTTPAFHSEVLTLRNQYGADLVDLVTSGASNEGGFSQQMANLTPNDTLGYSAIDESSLGPSNDTLAHEIGHNLGSAHARDQTASDPQPGATNDAYGYHVTDPNGPVYDDIMSVSQNSVRVPLYSNPNLTVDGMPFGVTGSANLSAAFPITAPIAAGYRSTLVADTSPPVAGVYEMDPNGQTLTFTVRYRDDEAVDATGIASDNVYVMTPEGFSLDAELLSVTGGTGNSFQKFATYRVALPTANEPLASLHVMLRATQIKDINGNFTPAGQLGMVSQDPGDNLPAARNLGTPSPTVIVSDSVGGLDSYDNYQFTVPSSPSNEIVSIQLSGMTANADVILYQDTNNNGLLDSNEQIATTFDPGSTNRTLDMRLAHGTYYLQVGFGTTPYTLTLSEFTDSTPPTATLDATDVKTTGVSAATFAVTYADNQEMSGQNARYDAQVSFHVQLDNGASFNSSTFPNGTLNTDIYPQDAPNYRTIYSYFAGSGGFTSNDNGLYTVIVPANTVKDAAGNFMPQTTLGSFRIAIGSGDTTLPAVASVAASAVSVPGPTTYAFNVTYHDNVALNSGTLDGSDLRITGPNSFSQLASFGSVTAATMVGANRTATYQITPPGGSWDYLDNGTYTISLQASQVKDSAGNSAAAGAIATFTVHCPLPGDASGDNITNALDFNALATNFGKFGRGYATGDFNFDGLVNSSDFALLAAKFGQSIPQNSEVAQARITPDLFGTTVISISDQSVEQTLPDWDDVDLKNPYV